MQTTLRRLRNRKHDERGAALLEFALVFGLFVFVLYGLIAFGFMLSLKNSITHAAAEGARAAIGVTDDPSTPAVDERSQAAQTRAYQSLSWLGSKIQLSDISVATPAHCTSSSSPTATCITVVITYPYATRPLVPALPGLGLVTPDNFKASAVVELTS
jgi:Flp pilus assembly protein TadG